MRVDELSPTERARRIPIPPRPGSEPPTDGLLLCGEVIGDAFEIVRRLGVGGMAEVYEAIDLRLGRRVALKIAPAHGAAALTREGRMLASLRHDGILRVHHMGVHDGLVYLVVELLGGRSLERHLDGAPPCSVADFLALFDQVTATLEYLHAHGIAHRDLKPDNIMVTPGERVILVDFGITMLEREVAASPTVSGSPHYMAPESFVAGVVPGEAHLVDLYALGVVAFRMLTGRLPFAEGSVIEIAQNHLDLVPPRVSAFRDQVPPRLDHLIAALLAKRPADRPGSIAAVRAQLRAVRRSLEEDRQAAPPRTVLIVDDDPAMCELLRACVQQAAPAASIQLVDSGTAALARLAASPFDLVLLDLDLPGVNGIEVFLQMSASPAAPDARVVVVSAYDDVDNRALLRQLGVHGFVSKREGLLDLEDSITDLMARVGRDAR